MRPENYTTKFYPNPLKKTEDGLIPIYLRITVNRKKSEIACKCGILDPELWDDLIQRERHSRSLVNPILSELETKIGAIHRELSEQGKQITSQLLKETFLFGSKQYMLLGEFVSSFFDKHINGSPAYTQATIKNYSGTIKYFLKFLDSTNRGRMLLANTSEMLIQEFDRYLLNVKIDANGKYMKANTRMKHHKRMKSVFRHAVDEMLLDRTPYTRFKIKEEPSSRTFLSRSELALIEDNELGGNTSLLKVRNIFLFSVYTGLRFNEAQQLRTENIEQDGTKFWLNFYQEKTHLTHRIPLLLKALSLIKMCEDTCAETGYLLPRISNQKVNSYLKLIGEMCGINKKLTRHVARHTHATTIMLSNGASMEVVSRQLGHTNIRTTQIYAKITNEMLSEAADMIEKRIG